MQILTWKMLSSQAKLELLGRPSFSHSASLEATVKEIISQVRLGGDRAIRELRNKYEAPDSDELRVPAAEFARLSEACDAELREAMLEARANIEAFHRPQLPSEYSVESAEGVECELRYFPLDSVGLYVPGGSAPLVSSLLMQAIPARLAGVTRIAMATPSPLVPAMAAAIEICEIDEVYAIGGAQAIAALAFGSESIETVAKVTGPGNAYVTEAKRQVSQMVGGPAIDMPAGPSEVMVIADDSADPRYVAADLLSQAEHGPDSQVTLICDSHEFSTAVERALRKLGATLTRKEVVDQALLQARTVIVEEADEAIAIANAYAPEHLILQTRADEEILAKVANAGSVFVGPYTPESAGDYASGTNHVLPTAGAARAYSGLKVTDFMRSMSVQRITKSGLDALAPTIRQLADAEGLDAHRLAVDIRVEGSEA